VVDEAGQPVHGIEVGLMYDNFDTGGARVKETNSGGWYRLEPVRPGTYYLTARPVPPYISDATFQPAGTVVPEEMAAQGLEYLFTFYPNATAAEGAQKIVINQGDDLIDVDIVVPRVRSPSVAGVVLLPGGELASRGRVTLHGDEGVYRSSGGVVGDDGTFEFPAVRPGRYMMKIATRYAGFEDQDCASLPITVGDEDIEGLVLASAPIARIRGRVTGQSLPNMRIASEVRAYPDGVISTQFSPNAGDVQGDGTFTTSGACGPTRLLVEGLPEGWYVESMRLGDRDITDQAVDFGIEATGQEVEIVLASGAPELSVEVVDADTGARRRGAVVVFPEDSSLWTYGSRFLAVSSATEQQAAVVHCLPPGDYLVAGFAGTSRGPRRFTALEYLSRVATPVGLEVGEVTRITLEVQ
jgi:hypothetical protein